MDDISVHPDAPPVSVLSIPSTRERVSSRWLDAVLQVGHRASAVAFLALLVTGAAAYLGRDFYLPLAVALGCADLALCAALLTFSFAARGQPQWREALGVATFNLSIAVVAVTLMVVARLGVLQEDVRGAGGEARRSVRAFLTPPPALPPQP